MTVAKIRNTLQSTANYNPESRLSISSYHRQHYEPSKHRVPIRFDQCPSVESFAKSPIKDPNSQHALLIQL
jgi:hypothetical protein